MSSGLLVPDAVWREVAASHPEKTGAADVLTAEWIERRAIKDTPLVNLLRQDLVGVLLEARRRGIVADPAAIGREFRDTAGFWISDDLMALLR